MAGLGNSAGVLNEKLRHRAERPTASWGDHTLNLGLVAPVCGVTRAPPSAILFGYLLAGTGGRRWRERSKLRSESGQGQPCRCGWPPGYLWRWQTAHWRQLRRQRTPPRNAPHCLPILLSVRRSSATSTCRHSLSSTGKTPQHPGSAKKSHKGVAATTRAPDAPADAAADAT